MLHRIFIQLNRWFRPSRFSAPRPSYDGIEPASVGTGIEKFAFLEPTKDRCGAARTDLAAERGKSVVGAPRVQGELLGLMVAQSSVAKYMLRRGGPSSQGWRTFLRKHAPEIAAMNLFVAPTVGLDQLYALVLVIVGLARRKLVCINVTAHPTAEWIARQVRGIPLGSSPSLPVSR